MSKFSETIKARQIELGLTDREVASHYGWGQQTFNSWKQGTIPRPKVHPSISRFLDVDIDEVKRLVRAAESEASARKGAGESPIYGHEVRDGKLAFGKGVEGYAAPNTGGCYAVRTSDGFVWANPKLKPQPGNTVILRAGNGTGEIAVWPVEVKGEAVHVVVVREFTNQRSD